MENNVNEYAIDIGYYQQTKRGQNVCGDTIIFERLRDENRKIIVLSDGLGSGVKANVLSTLTATMAIRYTAGFRDISKAAGTIMNTLPVCSQRKIAYATFSIADIDNEGNVCIVNYDNPSPVIIRKGKKFQPIFEMQEGYTEQGKKYLIQSSSFSLEIEDRIILLSDGVSQAGIGLPGFTLGWGVDLINDFVCNIISENPDISSRALSKIIVNQALKYDGNKAMDDITCAVIHYRHPRELLIFTGPPVAIEKDREIVSFVNEFKGKKIICGGTTAKIVSRELNKQITFCIEDIHSSFPPKSNMDGFELITEGMITLHSLAKILAQKEDKIFKNQSPAHELLEFILESDRIHFLVGTRINEAWQDPSLPLDMGLRKNIVAEIIRLIQQKYHKETLLRFV